MDADMVRARLVTVWRDPPATRTLTNAKTSVLCLHLSPHSNAMPRISSKHQITLPAAQCREAGIAPGDECRSYIHNGRITIVRLKPNGAYGCLAHLKPDSTVSDEDSRQDALESARR